MTPLDFLILALATWRIAYLLAKEDAPFALLARLRERTTLGGLLTCIYCCSVWAAIFCSLLLLTPARVVVDMAAVSGGALMLHRYTGGNAT